MKKFVKLFMAVTILFFTVEVKAVELGDEIQIKSTASTVSIGGTEIKYYQEQDGSPIYYIFCLDSARPFIATNNPTNPDDFVIRYNKSLSNSSYKYLPIIVDENDGHSQSFGEIMDVDGTRVKNVLLYAYLNGFGTLSRTGTDSRTGLSFDEYYAVVQMATWHAAHGYEAGGKIDSRDGLNMRDDVISGWLEDSTNGSKRTALLNELISAENEKPYVVDLKSSGNEMNPTSDEKYYVSSDYEIDGPTSLTYTVTAEGDACVLYEDTCEQTQTVVPGKKFQLRVDYSKDPSATATVVSSEFDSYTVDLYQPNTTNPSVNFGDLDDSEIITLKSLQNTTVVTPIRDKFEKIISVSGEKKTPESPATGIYTGIGLFGLVAACGLYYSISKKNKLNRI